MKIGDKLIHEGITAMLVEDDDCQKCAFNYGKDCLIMQQYCIKQTDDDDNGIFKQEELTRNEP